MQHKTLHEQKTVQLESDLYTLEIIRSSRRKRSIALSVPSHENILIRAPLRASIQEIDNFLLQQQPWILKKLTLLKNHHRAEIEYTKNLDLTPYSPQQIKARYLERALFWGNQLKVEFKQLRLSSAKKRWGSCNAENVIRINKALIKAPPELLDYVIVHELCHVRHKNHSASFWQLVASVMPDYRQRQKRLNQLGNVLLVV